MRKNDIIKTSLIFLTLICIVSIYANFHCPNCGKNQVIPEVAVNVNNKDYQVIFADKNTGVTKLVSASFDLDDLGSGKVMLKSLKLKNMTLSGLMDYGFEAAYYVRGSDRRDGGTIDQIKFIMSPWGKDNIPVHVPANVIYETNKPGEIQSIVDYATPFQLNFVRKNFSIDGNINISQLEEKFFNDSGRICNINCLHE